MYPQRESARSRGWFRGVYRAFMPERNPDANMGRPIGNLLIPFSLETEQLTTKQLVRKANERIRAAGSIRERDRAVDRRQAGVLGAMVGAVAMGAAIFGLNGIVEWAANHVQIASYDDYGTYQRLVKEGQIDKAQQGMVARLGSAVSRITILDGTTVTIGSVQSKENISGVVARIAPGCADPAGVKGVVGAQLMPEGMRSEKIEVVVIPEAAYAECSE